MNSGPYRRTGRFQLKTAERKYSKLIRLSKRKQKYTAAVLVLSSLCMLCACSSSPASESLRATGTYFDTVVTVEIWDGTQDILDQCMELCDSYEQMFSSSVEGSDVSRINSAGGSPVEVSAETAELIGQSLYYSDLSGGLFDITIASAVDLWDFSENTDAAVPDADLLAEAVSHIDYRCIKVSENTVMLTDPLAKIDLGGIAKGYIADRLKEYLISQGIEYALINLGGNMLAVGTKYDGSDYRIGIQKPFADDGTVMAVVSVSDSSVVSSGNYERFFEKDGIIYHHILDPDTGMPVENGLNQVTILSDLSVDGDALSTVCFIMGLEKGLEFIQSMDGVEAVFVTDSNELITSSDEIPLVSYED